MADEEVIRVDLVDETEPQRATARSPINASLVPRPDQAIVRVDPNDVQILPPRGLEATPPRVVPAIQGVGDWLGTNWKKLGVGLLLLSFVRFWLRYWRSLVAVLVSAAPGWAAGDYLRAAFSLAPTAASWMATTTLSALLLAIVVRWLLVALFPPPNR